MDNDMRLHDEVYLLRSRSYIQRNDLANKTYIRKHVIMFILFLEQLLLLVIHMELNCYLSDNFNFWIYFKMIGTKLTLLLLISETNRGGGRRLFHSSHGYL